MGIDSEFWVRVLLLNDVSACTIGANSNLEIIDQKTQIIRARLRRDNLPVKVQAVSGKFTIAGETFTGDRIVVLPEEPHVFSLNGEQYRGKLQLVISAVGNSFDAINVVPLEPYLAGVVGAEMPDYWEPEALKAQAIASRTYGLYIKRRLGQNRTWDVSKTQANQVYLGLKAESSQVWYAVNSTSGQVLFCRHNDGNEGIFPAYYSSVCGGHTQNSQDVFGDSFVALAGVPCEYCKDVAKINIFFWPMAKFERAEISDKLLQRYPQLNKIGQIVDIKSARQSDYGNFSRLTLVELVGSSGKSDFLRAEDFRLAIDPNGRNFKSTACRIAKWDNGWAFLAGRGWGHGVGMCQCGAEGMARAGKTASQILQHYYPGSKIVKIY